MRSSVSAAVILFAAVSSCVDGRDPSEGPGPGTAGQSIHRRGLPIERVYEGFSRPPAQARPFVRWWWNNNQVEKNEILRELDVLEAAGFGGIEINPIAGPNSPHKSRAKVLTWRSREWDNMLHAACQGAQDRGLIVDLIAGSGWPFGGEFLKPDEQIMRVSVVHNQMDGPTTFRKSVETILQQVPGHGRRKRTPVNGSLLFIWTYPKNLTSIDQVKQITGKAGKDGEIEIEIPKGEHVVAYGILQQGYRKVVHGARGAAGPTMDHMQKRVTRSYLNRLRGVEETWGEPLSTYVRAIFCDSIETAGANWTHGILDSFRNRKDYDIAPYLPFVTGPEKNSLDVSPGLADRLRRARYDWNEHSVSVFLDNFTAEYARFCHDHKLLSRYQAYGTPYLMDMAKGYMIPDIPETNNWLYSRGKDQSAEGRYTWSQAHGYMTWTKYAAAGGRLNGRKIISSEAMTNTARVFHTTLGTIKQSDDMNFIAGVTHSVLHGYNYVPPDVPFPGWIRFGTYFSEYNTWWPYVSLWTNYNARLSYVFQETTPVPEVALLGPTPDIWSESGLVRNPFHMTPDYLHRLWEALAQLGADCDYLHEEAIQHAKTTGGLLRHGPMAYRVLIVADMHSMQAETARAVQHFAEQGGKVIYVNTIPSRSPSLVEAGTCDRAVAAAAAGTVKAGAIKLPGPSRGADLTALRNWTRNALGQVKFSPSLSIKSPRDGLYCLRHRTPGEDVLFFTNTYRRECSQSPVAFDLGESGLWRWNPETGERTPYDLPYDQNGFEIDLRPLESILLVTGRKQTPKTIRRVSTGKGSAFVIETPWTVKFDPARSDKVFTVEMPALADFTESKDQRIETFSGTATYRTRFKLNNPSFTKLDLGWDNDFISEVELNGKKLGVNWYGSKLFDVSEAVKDGGNELIIRYTTTLWNHMKKKRLQPSGLIGPVTLQTVGQ